MNQIQIKDKVFEKFISEDEILEAVKKLASDVMRDADDHSVFVVVLKGAFMFGSEFAKHYTKPAIFDFIRVKSYRDTQSSGNVEVILDIHEDVKGKDVYVLEDIVDTGNTLEKIREMILSKNPASLKIVTLFFKPEAYKKNYPVDYKGFIIPNKFIVGYGLDYNELGRNLKHVYQLKK